MYKLITNSIDIINSSNNISWSSDSDTLGTQLTFESIKNLSEGAVVSLYNNSKEIFRGVIIKKTTNKNTWNYTVQDYSFYLKNKVIKQFNNINAKTAITSFLSEAYIQSNIVDIPTIINETYKNRTLAEIIDDILEKAAKDQGVEYFKEIEGNILYVRKLQDIKINPKVYIARDFTVDSSIENLKNKIQVIKSDGSEENAKILATAEAKEKQGWYGILSEIQEEDEENIAKVQNMANNLLKKSNVIERSTNVDLIAFDGADDIKANRMIYLNAGSLCNYYKIKSATHTLEKNLHKVSISIEWKVNV